MSAVVRRLAHAVCAWLLLSPAWAPAVILYSDPSRNPTPAADSIAYQPWQLQGQFHAFLGTPIAPSYFITAQHIGGNSTQKFTFQGINYSIDPAFGPPEHPGRVDIPNSDLAIWKISGTFPAYAPLYTNADETGKHIVVMGRGTPRGDPVTVSGNIKGWMWGLDDYLQSWGENDISTVTSSPTKGDMLQFDFNAGNKPNEATLSRGDSGGGVFIQDNDVWKLAAINYAVDGPFSKDKNGGSPFMAAMFDTTGLWAQTDATTWTRRFGPATAYASRISSRAPDIRSLAPGCPVVQQNYTIVSNVNVGTVDVADTITVGDGMDPAVLTAYRIRSRTLSINDGGQVVIGGGGTSFDASSVSTLDISTGAQLDLADNDLIVHADSQTRQNVLRHVTDLVKSGRNAQPGLWQGFGITSSEALNRPMTTLAVVLNDRGDGTPMYPTFGGLAVHANSILVKYTWNGDMNVDGVVNADDYFLIDSGFISRAGGYRNGDLNYDGVTNADDYFLIDLAYIGQTGPLGARDGPPAGNVPEPGAVAALTVLTLAILCRRRK